jgi:hypothetical protein
MQRRSFFLLSCVILSLVPAPAAAFEDPAPTSTPNQETSFGFDTSPSARPESSSARADHCMPPSYFFSMPTYKQHKTSTRRVVQSYGYDPGFAPDSDSPYMHSVTGSSLGWGNYGTPYGHLQYPGYGYPFASRSVFGF